MSNDNLFKILFFTLFTLMMVIRSYYGAQARRRQDSSWSISEESVDREGSLSVYVRGFLFVYMLAVVVIFAIDPDWISIFVIPLTPLLRWIGAILSTLSLPFLVWVHQTLGVHWSTNLRLRQEHRFVTGGPYRWVRHPMYTAMFIYFIGLSLLSANWLVVALSLASIVVLCRRMSIEEEMMMEAFEEYPLYMRHTGRLFPRFKRAMEDENYRN